MFYYKLFNEIFIKTDGKSIANWVTHFYIPKSRNCEFYIHNIAYFNALSNNYVYAQLNQHQNEA